MTSFQVKPSTSFLRACPTARDWDWYTMWSEEDGERGPFIMTQEHKQELEERGYKMAFYLKHLRPTICVPDELIEKRFPRLIKLLQWSFVLSRGEAVSTLRSYLQGMEPCCEAINWCGRTSQTAVKEAIAKRTWCTKAWRSN